MSSNPSSLSHSTVQPTALRQRISAIVPVLNEAGQIVEALGRFREAPVKELIVVDGGSSDGSEELAKPLSDLLLRETGGLARQLNRGAAQAAGEILFFPYVDTLFPEDWPAKLEEALADPTVVGGAFRLGFDSEQRRFKLIAALGNFRNRMGLGPLGDQGLFVRRCAFEEIGGFREDVLLEDLDLVRRLRGLGQLRIVAESVRTSTRRWDQGGAVATTCRNWAYLLKHLMGRHGARARSAYREYRSEH